MIAGLALLKHLGTERERVEFELRLRLLQGIALQAVSRYSATEVKQTCERASELCGGLGETPQLCTALMGVWAYTAAEAIGKARESWLKRAITSRKA